MTAELEQLADVVRQVVRDEFAAHAPKVALSITEAAAALSIGRTTAYKLVREGRLPSLDLGGVRVVPLAELEQWIASQCELGRWTVRTVRAAS